MTSTTPTTPRSTTPTPTSWRSASSPAPTTPTTSAPTRTCPDRHASPTHTTPGGPHDRSLEARPHRGRAGTCRARLHVQRRQPGQPRHSHRTAAGHAHPTARPLPLRAGPRRPTNRPALADPERGRAPEIPPRTDAPPPTNHTTTRNSGGPHGPPKPTRAAPGGPGGRRGLRADSLDGL